VDAPVAMEIGNIKRREAGQWKNNRAENSHQPLQQREAAMLKFRRMKTLQKFVAVHRHIQNHLISERHLHQTGNLHAKTLGRLAEWWAVVA
jgi:putative transposase